MSESPNEHVRVRFAPSPTGFLHVGGARTAIFNWLFAKNQGGKFLLRIEDTDSERSKSELSEQIIRSMKWMDLSADGAVVYQSDNLERYKQVVEEMLKNGSAYYCFESAGELEQKRNEAKALKIQYKYNRASYNLDKETVKKYLDESKPYAVRFFVPDGATEFEDIVHGSTSFSNSEIDDFIILRSDGSPVYQIAVVVDDHDMKISHVIRGDDHLSNTPKQVMIYRAMGWDVPKFAHLPMILDEEKKKLSKRRNPVAVEEYRDKGYLPEALFNFLTLLGFAPENNVEVISREELCKVFTFDRVNKKSAVFDMKKLNWINSEYIKNTDEIILCGLINENLKSKEYPEQDVEYLKQVISLMKERVNTINDFIEFGKYFFIDPESYDEKGIAKHWTDEKIKQAFKDYSKSLGQTEDFTPEKLEQGLRQFAEVNELKAGQLIHPLRLALTGITISPGIFELMEVLGKNKVISRIERFLNN